MPGLVRGFSVQEVANAVALVEQAIFPGETASRQSYWPVGYWFVARRYLNARWRYLLFRPEAELLPQYHLPFRRRLSRFLRELRPAQAICISSRCQVICVRNNVRAFYFGEQPSSIKIHLSKSRSVGMFRNDIAARSELSGQNFIHAPRIMESCVDGPVPYFREQLLVGRRPEWKRDRAVLQHLVCSAWPNFYAWKGITPRHLSHFVSVKQLVRGIENAASHTEWKPEWNRPDVWLRTVQTLLCADPKMLCAFGHGDLSLSNLVLLPGGQLYMTDWELAGEIPIARDLLRLILLEAGDLLPLIERGINQAQPDTSAFPFTEQLLIAVLWSVAEWGLSIALEESARSSKMHSLMDLAHALFKLKSPAGLPAVPIH